MRTKAFQDGIYDGQGSLHSMVGFMEPLGMPRSDWCRPWIYTCSNLDGKRPCGWTHTIIQQLATRVHVPVQVPPQDEAAPSEARKCCHTMLDSVGRASAPCNNKSTHPVCDSDEPPDSVSEPISGVPSASLRPTADFRSALFAASRFSKFVPGFCDCRGPPRRGPEVSPCHAE